MGPDSGTVTILDMEPVLRVGVIRRPGIMELRGMRRSLERRPVRARQGLSGPMPGRCEVSPRVRRIRVSAGSGARAPRLLITAPIQPRFTVKVRQPASRVTEVLLRTRMPRDTGCQAAVRSMATALRVTQRLGRLVGASVVSTEEVP